MSRQTDRPRAGSAVLITVMWVLVTIHASITWAKLDDTYIQHGETRETQLSSLPLFRVEHLAVVVIDAVVILISLLLADMTMVSVCRLRRLIYSSEPLIDLEMLGAIWS